MGGTASRNKGARWETALRRFLREAGYLVLRSNQRKLGGDAEPDLLAAHYRTMPLLVECKDRKTLPSKAHVEALLQAEAAGPGLAIAVHKIARRPIGDAIVNLRLGAFLELMERATHGNRRQEDDGAGGGETCSGREREGADQGHALASGQGRKGG